MGESRRTIEVEQGGKYERNKKEKMDGIRRRIGVEQGQEGEKNKEENTGERRM